MSLSLHCSVLQYFTKPLDNRKAGGIGPLDTCRHFAPFLLLYCQSAYSCRRKIWLLINATVLLSHTLTKCCQTRLSFPLCLLTNWLTQWSTDLLKNLTAINSSLWCNPRLTCSVRALLSLRHSPSGFRLKFCTHFSSLRESEIRFDISTLLD